MTGRVSVLVADDHARTRAMVREALEQNAGFHVCAEASDANTAVAAGEASLPGSLVARLVEEFRDRESRRVALPNARAARLAGREWDVLELMRKGATTATMSPRLFVSQTTVRDHISSILRKLGVEDRRAAIQLFETN